MTETTALKGRIGVIVAARTGSTRLPGKALRLLGGKPMILFLLERIQATREAHEIILATTSMAEDDGLAETVEKAGFSVFRGANEDVVQRYVDAAGAFGLDCVVRVTGDCPFVNAETLDHCLSGAHRLAPFDLASTKGRFPVGIDYEIYMASTMAQLNMGGELDADDREHLTLFMYHHQDRFRLAGLEPRPEWRSERQFTVDTVKDYERALEVVKRFGRNDFSIADLVSGEAGED